MTNSNPRRKKLRKEFYSEVFEPLHGADPIKLFLLLKLRNSA